MVARSDEAIIYGINPISVLIQHAPERIIRLLMVSGGYGREQLAGEARAVGIEVVTARDRQLDHYVPDAQHQGVMAFTRPRPFEEWSTLCDPKRSHLLVALDQVTDPRNFGAILRSAEAFGVSGALITSNRCARPGPIVAKTSAGASELIPIAMETNLSQSIQTAKDLGYQIVGAAMSGRPAMELDWSVPSVIVIGAEGKGLREKTISHCDQIVSIEMSGRTESLNASVAAGVLFYEATRASKKKI